MPHRTLRLGALLIISSVLAACDSGPPPLDTITVTPGDLTLSFLGETRTLAVTLTDTEGQDRTDVAPTWSSSSPGVAEVSELGVVTARGNGTAVLSASAGGVTSNTVTVTVEQSVATLALEGDDLAFTFLGETGRLQARALDQGGAAVEGASVQWTSSNSGVASVASDGTVTAEGDGTATVRARADGTSSDRVTVTVDQVAVEVHMELDGQLVSGEGPTFRSLGETAQLGVEARDAGGSVLDRPEVTWSSDAAAVAEVSGDGLVTARGDGEARITARVDDVTTPVLTVTVDQEVAEVTATPDLIQLVNVGETAQLTGTALDAGGTPVAGAELSWTSSDPSVAEVEPTTGGTVTVTGVGEGSAEITARAEGVTSRAVAVGVGEAAVTTLIEGERIRDLSGATGSQRFFKVEVPAGTGELIVGTGRGPGNADLYLRRGAPPTTESFDCASEFSINDELCEVRDPGPGEWFVLVHATSGYSGLEILGLTREGPAGLDLDLRFTDGVSEEVKDVVREASARWEALLPTEMRGFWVEFQNACGDFVDLDLDDPVEDATVVVEVTAIDGQGQTLAQATPCLVRNTNAGDEAYLVAAGALKLDEADVAALQSSGLLVETILHELGHVLGFGSLWPTAGLIDGAGGSDPIFTGAGAREAFDQVGGTSYEGAKVPVENTGGDGTRDGHWRETVFDDELMTSFVESGRSEALSVVTVRAMEDLNWIVDTSLADDYELPGGGGGAVRSEGAEDEAPVRFHLVDDIPDVDLYGIDEEGRIHLIRRAGG